MKDKLFFLESGKEVGGSINSLNDNIAFLNNYFSICIAYYRKNKYTDSFDENYKTFHIDSPIYSRETLKKKLLSLNVILNSGSELGDKIDRLLFSTETAALTAAINLARPEKIIANISPVIDRPIYFSPFKFIQHFRSVSGINSKTAGFYKKAISDKAIKCIFNSHYTKNIWESYIGEIAPAEVIYNPFKKNVKTNTPGATFNIGIISRFEKRKNHIKLVDAFAELSPTNKNINLFMYGEGDEKENVVNYINDKSLKGIHLMGNEYDKDKIYNNLDLVVLPAYNEALGRVLIEAMSYGIPVIGSNQGGILEIIEDGYNGYLIDPDDHNDIAEKMEQALNAAVYKKLQLGAAAIFSERFDENIIMPKLLAAYRQTVNFEYK